MEGILFDIELFSTPITVLSGWCCSRSEHAVSSSATWPTRRRAGRRFSGRSPRSPEVSVSETPAESVRYLRAA